MMDNSSQRKTTSEGVGRSRARARKTLLDERPSLKVEQLFSSGIAREGRVVAIGVGGTRMHVAASASHLAIVADGGRPQLFPLHRYRLGRRLGGVPCAERVLAVCGCGRRASRLVLHRGGFTCRHCFGLRYQSDYRLSHDQLLDRMAKLVRQVGGEGTPAAFPERPRFMKRSHYARLAAEFHELDERWNRVAYDWLSNRRVRKKRDAALEP
jgi:hypothetical protein